MYYFIVVTGLAFLFYFVEIKKNSKVIFMSRDFTTAIKGLAIFTIIWAHLGARLGINGIQFIAGIGVSLFLICSGYGLEISYQHNGLEDFWKKRFFDVFSLFWIVEFIGLCVTGMFTLDVYFKDFLFIMPATSYGWFMQYIAICYMIFFLVKLLFRKKSVKIQLAAILVGFIVWFLIESIFFANPDMPFLKARQMLAFPFGMFLAQYKTKLVEVMGREDHLFTFFRLTLIAGGGLFFTGVTQLNIVKTMPYVVSNFLSFLTVMPLAIVVLEIGRIFSRSLQSKMLKWLGILSYELYLVHSFTLKLVQKSSLSLLIFIFTTVIFAYLLHLINNEKNKRLKRNNNG